MDQEQEMEAKGLVGGAMVDPGTPDGTPEHESAEPAETEASEGQEPGETEGQEPGETEELTPQAVRSQMNLPPELREPYERVVLAGYKVLFSDETHDAIVDQLAGDGPIAQRVGEGITRILGMLFTESNGTIPPEVIVPAGIELTVAASDFLIKGGLEDMQPRDVGDAVGIMIQTVMQKFDVKPENVQEGGEPGAEPAPGQPQPGGGLVGGAMTEEAPNV